MQWLIDIILGACSQVPSGTIVIWSGDFASIPDGWAQCNGNGGTVDLRDLFVLCKGPSHDLHDLGGSTTHTHTGDSIHKHELDSGTGVSGGKTHSDRTGVPITPGTTGPTSTLPPFHVLFYIQKL